MGGQQMGMALRDVETPQERAAVDAITRAIQVCGFCADQCVQQADPSMIDCIQLCEDVTEIGETALAIIPRDSRFTGSVLQTFRQAAQACAQECSRHHHAHCQECAQELDRAIDAVDAFLGGGQGGYQGQQMAGTQ